MYNFEFELSKEDFLIFGKDIYSIPRIRNTQLLPTIFLLIFIYIIFAFMFKDLIFLIIFSIMIIFIIYSLFNNGHSMYKANKSSSLLRRMKFDNDSFSIETGTSTASFNYESVTELYDTKHTIFLFQNKQVAIMIPKRVLKDDNEAYEFFAFLSNKIHNK